MKEHIIEQTRLLDQDDGIMVQFNNNKSIHGYYRGYSKSDDILALRLDGLDGSGRARVIPINGKWIKQISADEDIKAGEVVDVVFLDVKTGRNIPMTFTRSDDMKHISIRVQLDGEEIERNQDALYARLAATLTEHFRSIARNVNVEYE